MMFRSTFADDLARYGPQAVATCSLTREEAFIYCQNLAQSHYENFAVASFLLPRHLRPHFHAIYSYCRWADDLADEVPSTTQSMELMQWWEEQLHACYLGSAQHPVFIAMSETVQQFDIPKHPFLDLLSAFRQDQSTTHYRTFDELRDYCCRSANPVGQLVLYLGRCASLENILLADYVCTGLQLANFWQDVGNDFRRGRVYLPQEDRTRFGYTEEDLQGECCNEAFVQLMEFEVDRAEQFFQQGRPLIRRLPKFLRLDVSLFIEGGLAILQKLRDCNYQVWGPRPRLSKWEKMRLVPRAYWHT